MGTWYDSMHPSEWDSAGGKPLSFDEVVEDFPELYRQEWQGELKGQLPSPEKMEVCKPYPVHLPGPCGGLWMIICKDDEDLLHFYVISLSGRSIGKMSVRWAESEGVTP